MGEYLKKWVIEHKEIKEDTWTPDTKKTATSSGVWQ